jgi:two-component system sensor histidine kinase DesK
MRLLPADRDLGWTPFVWLVYLGAYVLAPFVLGATTGQWVWHVTALLVFLPLYFAGHWYDGRERLPIVLAIVTLGLATTWMNPGGAVFFVYAASFIGGAVTGRPAVAWVLAITAVGLVSAWTAGPLRAFALVFVAVFAPLIGFVNLNAAGLRRRDASLRLAQDEVARLARLAERDRIAADLHDLLGHTLSVIVLKADLAVKLIDRDPARAVDEVRDVARVSREALAEVRQAVQGVRATTLADELARATAVLRGAGINVHVDGPPPLGPLPASAEANALALVLREAVTNILRHARATRCEIHLRDDAGTLTLIVQDNGQGGDIREGNGWSGIRRRVEDVGGSVSREVGRGVRLTAVVPHAPREEPAR